MISIAALGLSTATQTTSAIATPLVTIGGINSPPKTPNPDWNLSGETLLIGDGGTGFMRIEDGGRVSNRASEVGIKPGGDGTATITGTGSIWTQTSSLIVGDDKGRGTVDIESGGKVINTFGSVGKNGGTGTVTVTGAGSTWTNNRNFLVGEGGQGTLNIEAGGTVTNNESNVGTGSASNFGTGVVTITGPGSTWANNGTLFVGNGNGHGTVDIKNGGTVTNINSVVGQGSGKGLVTVAGTGSFWNQSSSLTLGQTNGEGTLTIQNGGKVSNTSSVVGLGSSTDTGTGFVTVEGTGSTWTHSSGLFIGKNQGTGGLKIDNGGTVSNVNSVVGLDGGTGTVTATGAGTIWTQNTSLVLGQNNTGSPHTQGTLTIDQDAVVTAASVTLGQGTNASGNLHLQGDATLGRGILETGQLIKGIGAAALDLNGGVLRASADQSDFLSGFAAVQLGAQGVVFDTNNHAVGVSTAFSSAPGESSGLTLQGPGTLTLNGANTYSGPTTINAGTLALGTAGSLSSQTALSVASGAAFDTSAAASDKSIGSLAGAGAVTLGPRTLTAGGNGTSTTFSGVISGTGGFTKTGTGTLALSGINTYSGSTIVSAGRLDLAGSLASSQVRVDNGAILGGTGTVGSTGSATLVQSGATIAAGDMAAPYGTLKVTGNLTFGSGAIFLVNVDPQANRAGKLQVSGMATLTGGVVQVNRQSLNFNGADRAYSILEAQTVTGQFARVNASFAYLDAALNYTNQTVQLTLTRKAVAVTTPIRPIAFSDLAQTDNQRVTANSLEALPTRSALHNFVLGLPEGAPPAVFNQLSGEIHAHVGVNLVSLGAYVPGISRQHLHNHLTAGFRPGAPIARHDGLLPTFAGPSPQPLPVWVEVVGHWQSYGGNGNAAPLKQRTTGLFLGMDEEVGHSGWRLGGSVGTTHANGKMPERASESDVNSYSAALYGGKRFETGTGSRIHVMGGLAYTWHGIKTTRHVSSLGQTLKADYSAHTAQWFAEVGYAIGQHGKVGFEPFVGVSLGGQRTRGFRETGGFAALSGHSSTDRLATTTLGVRMHSDFHIGNSEGRLRATVGWRHAFGEVNTEKAMAFEGGQSFSVAGVPLARNTAVLGLEAEMALGRHTALLVGYHSEIGRGNRDHSAQAKLRWAF